VDDNYAVVNAAAEALGQIGDARAVKPLIGLLRNEEFTARCEAAAALGLIGDERAVQPLVAALKDAESNVRKDAAKALGTIADTRAMDGLVAVLKDDKDVGVQMTAAEVLEKIPLNPDDQARRTQALAAWRERKAAAARKEAELSPEEQINLHFYALGSGQEAKPATAQGSKPDAGGMGSPQKAVVCCICGANMSGQPIMQDGMTGAVYCSDDADYFELLKEPQAFSACPACGFKYSSAYSRFAKGSTPECPGCHSRLYSAP
jgi:hypothetical protein